MQNKLQAKGFNGFITIQELMRDSSPIPQQMGIYVVLRENSETPEFLETGTGGFFKGKDPNVPIEKLKKNWVSDASIVYIGKAGGARLKATLKSRLEQYMKFGQGKDIGHQGGRYIWQLKDSRELIVCWKVLSKEDPEKEEKKMIQEFKMQHNGMRPFANLRD